MRRVALALIMLSMTGCASLPFANPPSQPRQISSWHQREETVPVAVGTDPTGKTIIANQVTRTYDVNREETGPKKSWWSGFIAWFLGLGAAGMALYVLLVLFAPAGLVGWAVSKYYQLKKRFLEHQAALQQTVKAIHASNAVDEHAALSKALDAIQTEPTKVLVGQIKGTL